MKYPYRSPKSVAKNPTIPIDINDPRLDSLNRGITKARSGSEIDVVDYATSRQIVAGSYSATNLNGGKTPPDPDKTDKEIRRVLETELGEITNLTLTRSGEDMIFEFDFDPNLSVNRYATEFRVILTSGDSQFTTEVGMFPINLSLTHHEYTLTQAQIEKTMNVSTVDFDSFCVYAFDKLSTEGGTPVCATTIPPYVLNLAAPEITIVAVNNGYVTTVTNTAEMAKSAFRNIDVWEIESNAGTAPAIVYASDGITPTNYNRVYLSSINPATIISPNLNKRWVIVRFTSKYFDKYSAFSTAYAITPISPVNVDLTPPDEATSISATWSGDNILLSYTPAEGAVRFVVELTAPDSNVGYFYFFLTGTGAQTSTITKNLIFGQFGAYYSSYSGVIKSIDAADNHSAGAAFNVAARSNPLSGVTPTFTVNPTANGYIVTWTNVVGMTYAEVYENSVSWGGTNPTNDDLVVYSGQSPVTIQSLNYTTRYIKIRFYDDYGNNSNYSAEQTVVPYDPGLLSLIENPVTFETDGSIIAGSYDELNNTVEYPAVIFNRDGIFAYDENGDVTTQIINTALEGQNTFITTQAQIADWTIHPTKIENTLTGAANTYTGLSASGTYAIWAGSPVAGGSEMAKFWVKPDGSVQASDISIVGGSLDIGGGTFEVDSSGALIATSASITGEINASSGSFTGNLFIGTSGSIYSGTVTPGSPPTLTGQGFILNNEGLRFNSSTTNGVTTIDGTTGLLITKSAQIGGWNVDSTSIYKTGTSGTITLDSTKAEIILAAATTYKSGIAAATANDSHVFWAGIYERGSGNQNLNAFYVKADGSLYASKAVIKGDLFGGLKNSVFSTENGYFLKSDGQFNIGTSTTGISLIDGSFQIKVNSDLDEFRVSGITQDNADFSKNDPTLVAVVHDNTGNDPDGYQVTRGRRFYWGFGYTPTEAAALGNGTVADILYAQAGDIFFSTAS